MNRRARCPTPQCEGKQKKSAIFTRTEDGESWYCFRCEQRGFIGDDGTVSDWGAAAVYEFDESKRRIGDGLSDFFADLWHHSLPVTVESIAGQYLRARRCVLPPEGSDVRWHPQVKHSPSKRTGPGPVSLVTCAKANTRMSIHRTWIKSNGQKADLDPPRMAAAKHPVSGGVIRIWPDEDVSTGLAITEGIETALSVARVHTPVWAAIDAGNLGRFPVLDGIECLTVFADHDAHGKGLAAATECARRWDRAGLEVHIGTPPDTGADWNDIAQETAA